MIKLEDLKQEDGTMAPNAVDKIADIVAHVLASKADVLIFFLFYISN